MQKGFVFTWLIVGLVIVALVVGGGYWTYKTQVQKSKVSLDQYGMPIITPSKSPETNNKPTLEAKPSSGPDEIGDCKTDSDCTINTCSCTAVSKKLVQGKHQCAQGCMIKGSLRCLNGRCIITN